VASGLDHAHARSVIHRDLKPDNVLVRTSDGRAMVTDFGIARALVDSDLTQTGRAMGTYAYMSPEQCEGVGDLSTRSDVYSFAAMLYEVVTGEPPFGRGMNAVAGHLGRPVPSVRLTSPNLPGELDAVLGRGLAKSAQARYPTAGALVADFQAVLTRPRTAEDETVTVEDETVLVKPAVPVKPADEEVDKLYADGQAAHRAGRWWDAVGCFRRTLDARPGYRDAQALLAESVRQHNLQTAYAGAWRAMHEQRWADAAAGFSSVLQLDPTHGDARQGLEYVQRRWGPPPVVPPRPKRLPTPSTPVLTYGFCAYCVAYELVAFLLSLIRHETYVNTGSVPWLLSSALVWLVELVLVIGALRRWVWAFWLCLGWVALPALASAIALADPTLMRLFRQQTASYIALVVVRELGAIAFIVWCMVSLVRWGPWAMRRASPV
jgi:hypothetical protein